MPKYFLLAAIMLIIFTVSGCFPSEPVIRLSLEDQNKILIMGTEYIRIEESGIEAIAAFAEEYDRMLLFDISIANYTDSILRIEPEKFYFLEEGKSEYALRGIKSFAYDPEQKILEYDKMGKREDAVYASNKLANTTLSILDFAAGISAFGKARTEEELEEAAAADEYIANQWESANLEHENAEAMLDGGMKQWAIYALRKTDLPPGYAVRGMVYFPARIYAKRITLYFPIGDRTIKLIYNQQKY